MPPRARHILIAALLIVSTWAVYGQTLAFEFVSWDDPHYVTENPHVTTGPTWENMRWAWTTGHGSNWHPLTWLSLMLDAYIFGLSPQGFHFTNVMLHSLAALLLYVWLARYTSQPWCAAVVAGLFTLHPLRVESVAWVTERKDVLSGVFAWASLWAYCHYAQRPSVARYICVTVALIAGLLTKPMLVTWPAVMLLLDIWPLNRIGTNDAPDTDTNLTQPTSGRSRWSLLLEKLPWFAVCIAFALIIYRVQNAGGSVTTSHVGHLTQRIANAVVAYATYLGKTVWPTDLYFHYPHPYMPGGGGLSASTIAISIVVLAAISLLVIVLRRRRYMVVGWLWFLGTGLPTAGLIQAGEQARADRFTYLPLVGIYIMLAFGGAEMLARSGAPPKVKSTIAGIAAGLALLALTAASYRQANIWHDSRSLYAHALSIDPTHPIANVNLGLIERQSGQPRKAIEHYRIALERNPHDARASLNLGVALEQLGRVDEAIDAYRVAANLDSASVAPRYHLGKAQAAIGQFDNAISALTEALRLAPRTAAHGDLLVLDIHYTLGLLYANQQDHLNAAAHLRSAWDAAQPDWVDRNLTARIGVDLVRSLCQMQRRRSEIQSVLRGALDADAQQAQVVFALGNDLARDGRFEAAAAVYGVLAEAMPTDALVHNNHGNALVMLGRFTDALRAYEHAVTARPGWLHPMHGIARICATHPDAAMRSPKRAIDLAERVCAADNRAEPRYLDTLAIAYAADGRFNDAVTTANEAIAKATARNQRALAEDITRRLMLFERHQSYSEPLR